MKIVADIHLHSHFSRATSKNLNLEYLSKWAQLKGVHVVGTGDIAHPGWLAEMKKKLEPAEDGLFRLKEEFAKSIQTDVPKSCHGTVRFMLAGEISNIYKKNDKVRKIHNVVFMPSFDAVEKFQARLEKIGNIRADGRPILGLDSRDLLEIVLETDPQGHFIPAHIWTPWFALFGSMSGFDSIEECFEDLTGHIFALETGLSSDPPMNWRLSALDNYTLVSNSDAHSPPKLAREANVFDTELSYPALFNALKTGDPKQFLGTIEFFPEEGKYHYDGHRKCKVRWDPKTTLKHNRICPECGREVTVGVMHRVNTLADRALGEKPAKSQPFRNLIPLPEILAEVYSCGVNTKRVNESWEFLLSKLGPELHILEDAPLVEIEKLGGSLLSEGIRRMRKGEVQIAPGYDGEYGSIRLFEDLERAKYSSQLGFFEEQIKGKPKSKQQKKISGKTKSQNFGTSAISKTSDKKDSQSEQTFPKNNLLKKKAQVEKDQLALIELNSQQEAAVLCIDKPVIIVAGPGTGKTRTLTHRIAYLVGKNGIEPQNILALTFTNKAAQEMQERLNKLLDFGKTNEMTIETFHALGAQILRQDGHRIGVPSNFSICTEKDQLTVLKNITSGLKERNLKQTLEAISKAKSQLLTPKNSDENLSNEFKNVYQKYQSELRRNHMLDFDDLIFYPVQLFQENSQFIEKYSARFKWISVDEYQDINFAQYQLLRLLTSGESNLCVIGDPDQAIYGFRGANKEFFLKFQEDFPNAITVALNQNYRSSQTILNASSQLISKNPERKNVDIWSGIISQTKLEIYSAPTDKAEAEYVVHEIEKMVGGTSYFSLDSERVINEAVDAQATFSDFAVLFRLNAQSRLLIEAFQRSGIPYQTVGETPFYERKEVSQILDYLKLLNNPTSDCHKKSVQNNRDRKNNELNFFNQNSNLNAIEVIEKIIEKFYPPNYFDKNEKLKVLLNQLFLRCKPFENRLSDFLDSTVLQTETDEYDPRVDRVTLMTLHASKGLEFPVILIVGCEENLIPYQKKGEELDLEEERRLFYVGMTRAQKKLILMNAKKRFLFGKQCENSPSRFLNDIEEALKEIKQRDFKKKIKEMKKRNQLDLF
ncbi:UvrD-helicase domain-containing protein [candidate division KSB1 bacterium]|nr:UvrD-helicase domain-containing protein [candidate division KSB1 bacterium]